MFEWQMIRKAEESHIPIQGIVGFVVGAPALNWKHVRPLFLSGVLGPSPQQLSRSAELKKNLDDWRGGNFGSERRFDINRPG